VKRAVLDTNTIISGLLSPKSPPGKILDLAMKGKFSMASSEHLVQELRRALKYEKVTSILTKRGWTEEDFSRFIEEFRKICTISQGNPLSEQMCRDPDDDWLLACAEESGAKLIVSGDKDVTSLKKYKGIRILDARSFLEEFT
jgi:putative PIN family toxin of toxin-antitoxin system